MATFHIHMGLPKTGSTTFQNTLQMNAGHLSRKVMAINRMCAGVQRQGLLRAHAYIRKSYVSGIDVDVLRTHLETAFACDLAAVTEGQPVLVTDEGLCGPHPGQFADHDGVFPALPAALDALAAVFPRGKTVFHIVVRGHAGWVKSLYNQAVKQTGYTQSFETFAKSFPEDMSIETHIEGVRSAHPDKDIRIHKMEEYDLFPGEQILVDCGMTPADIRKFKVPDKRNQSWSQAMLQAMRVVNGADIDQKSKNIIRKEIARNREIFKSG